MPVTAEKKGEMLVLLDKLYKKQHSYQLKQGDLNSHIESLVKLTSDVINDWDNSPMDDTRCTTLVNSSIVNAKKILAL